MKLVCVFRDFAFSTYEQCMNVSISLSMYENVFMKFQHFQKKEKITFSIPFNIQSVWRNELSVFGFRLATGRGGGGQWTPTLVLCTHFSLYKMHFTKKTHEERNYIIRQFFLHFHCLRFIRLSLSLFPLKFCSRSSFNRISGFKVL